jgi:hypothetical protein
VLPAGVVIVRVPARPRALLVVSGLLGVLATARADAAAPCYPIQYYGTYGIGTKAGPDKAAKVPIVQRLEELRALGGNIVITGKKPGTLAKLPPGMLAIPGCGLMKKKDWQVDGAWDEAHARVRLAELAKKFAHDPRVYGICLTHEITEFADHARRVWMYKLAKEYFPEKKVLHYYGTLYDQLTPGERVFGYGQNGEVETDVFFVTLPAVGKDGKFAPDKAERLKTVLENAARTPQIPVWGQTSINADQKYVKGPESMTSVWGPHGENMKPWTDSLFNTVHTTPDGQRLRLSGFLWRSLGKFPYDLGYPAFKDHREQVRVIAGTLCHREEIVIPHQAPPALSPPPEKHKGKHYKPDREKHGGLKTKADPNRDRTLEDTDTDDDGGGHGHGAKHDDDDGDDEE